MDLDEMVMMNPTWSLQYLEQQPLPPPVDYQWSSGDGQPAASTPLHWPTCTR